MKRVLALFLSLLFVMTMLPAVSLAEDTFVVTPPSKTTYVRGEAYDASGFAVTYNGTDVTALSTVDISSTYYDGSKFVKSGTTNVTVIYNNTLTSTFELKIVDYRIDGLTIVNKPTDLAYTVGEALEPAGLSVTPEFTYYNTDSKTVVKKTLGPVVWSATNKEQFTFAPAVFSEASTDAAVSVQYTTSYPINGKDTALTFKDSFSGIEVKPKLATALAIDKKPSDLLLGYPQTVTATVTPADATDTYTWTSSAPAVATVAADSADPLKAVVTPVAAGSVTITVKNSDGAATDSFTVTVADSVSDVKIMEAGAAIDSYNILEGSEHKLTVKTTPAEGANTVVWKLLSGEDAIDKAVFEASGTLVALKEGTATVQASCLGVASQVVTINVIDAATADKRYDFIEIEGLSNRYFMVGDYFNPSVLDVRAYVKNEANDELLGDVLPVGTFQYSITNVKSPSTKRSGVSSNPFNAAGTAKLTVYYTFKYQHSNGTWSTKTLSNSTEIYVYFHRPFMVVIGEAPFTSTYYQGETLDTKGLSVKVAYTTDGFEVANPEISKYESLTIDTVSMPDLYDEITAEDVAIGHKDYKIS
ncbi:MAG: Ig-like domain-containing protein, partial [Clostridia bacterium]|nr:Ig-like domain-containing protein [Clostridia bacterium]